MNNLRPPRFPCVAALLCAACVGAAVWAWMTYSYCWQLPISCLPVGFPCYKSEEAFVQMMEMREPLERLEGRYICCGVPLILTNASEVVLLPSRRQVVLGSAVIDGSSRGTSVLLSLEDAAQRVGGPLEVRGRARATCRYYEEEGAQGVLDGVTVDAAYMDAGPGEAWGLFIDTTASRFHGGSIAGLVVGAMGVFVLTVALRHWLNQRRAFHVRAVEIYTHVLNKGGKGVRSPLEGQ